MASTDRFLDVTWGLARTVHVPPVEGDFSDVVVVKLAPSSFTVRDHRDLDGIET